MCARQRHQVQRGARYVRLVKHRAGLAQIFWKRRFRTRNCWRPFRDPRHTQHTERHCNLHHHSTTSTRFSMSVQPHLLQDLTENQRFWKSTSCHVHLHVSASISTHIHHQTSQLPRRDHNHCLCQRHYRYDSAFCELWHLQLFEKIFVGDEDRSIDRPDVVLTRGAHGQP